MKKKAESGYNERLFSSGLRKYLHEARFLWLRRKLLELPGDASRVVELGCFDGKVLNYFPVKPDTYVGLDADWEDALSLARERWRDCPSYHFRQCETPEQMGLAGENFDIAIVMETLEHVPVEMVRPYLANLAEVTDRYLLITAPNEKGIVFFFKHLAKLLFGEVEKHTLSEFINASLGRMDRIQRGHHKGFDYDWLKAQVEEHFDIVEVSGLPFRGVPAGLSFTVAMVARKRGRG